MKCPNCGITVPEMPEDSSREEQLCNQCYERFEFETNLGIGDQVFWNDPDEGICSGYYKVVKIDKDSGVVDLINDQDSYTQAYLSECS